MEEESEVKVLNIKGLIDWQEGSDLEFKCFLKT